jgi:hypothetical protein
LGALRGFDQGEVTAKAAADSVMAYHRAIETPLFTDEVKRESKLAATALSVQQTLDAAPWKQCGCDICSKVGVEVIIFRSNNHNRRRGFHNLGAYHRHVQRTLRESS